MPDLRERFDYPAVIDSVTQPAFDDLLQQAGRRRTRRTAAVAGGLVAVAVVAAIAMPMLLRGPAAPHRPSVGAVGDPWPVPTGLLLPKSMTFFNATHGYALLEGFNDQPGNDTCQMAVRATTDGGKTWSAPRGVPCDSIESGGWTGGLHVLDTDSLLQITRDGDRYYLSHDSGRRWEAYQPRTRTVDSFPAGVVPQAVCAGGEECVDDNRLEWYDPQTGDRMRLADGPALGTLRTVERATDGSIWISGYAKDRQYAVAVTRNNGRTWTTTPTGLTGKILEGPNVATHDGTVGYLVIDGKATDGQGNTYRRSIMRTDDGGKTWSRVVGEDVPAEHFGVFEAIVAPAGRLLIPGSNAGGSYRWYASDDGGVSFAPADGFPAVSFVSHVPGVYYGSSADGPLAYYVSDDAVHWRKVQLT